MTATVRIGIRPTKAWLSQLVNFKDAILTSGDFRRTIYNKILFWTWKNATEHMQCFRLLFDHVAWIEHQFLSCIRDSRKPESLWGMMRDVGRIRKSEHQSRLAKVLGLGLQCWGFKGVQEEIPWEEANTLQIGSVAFPAGQCKKSTTLSLSRTIWPRWASRQSLSLPVVQTLLYVTFGYSLSPGAVVMRQLKRWKRLWRRSLTRSRKRTSMGPWRSCWNGTTSALRTEEITSKGTRISCVKVSIRKKSWNLSNDLRIRVCVRVCMCTWVVVCLGSFI